METVGSLRNYVLCVSVCMDSSFQINLLVWHTLCLTGEACHPTSPVHILIMVRGADLPFTPSTAKPISPLLSLSLIPSFLHTLPVFNFHFSITRFSLSSLIPDVLLFTPPSLSLPFHHTKLGWSHYFEEKWLIDVREGGSLFFLFLRHRFFFSSSRIISPVPFVV